MWVQPSVCNMVSWIMMTVPFDPSPWHCHNLQTGALYKPGSTPLLWPFSCHTNTCCHCFSYLDITYYWVEACGFFTNVCTCLNNIIMEWMYLLQQKQERISHEVAWERYICANTYWKWAWQVSKNKRLMKAWTWSLKESEQPENNE